MNSWITRRTFAGWWSPPFSSGRGPADESDVLRPGREMTGAGYIVFGAGTVLVLATEQGVHGFSLDPMVGEFFLSHPDIRMPARATIYSINDAHQTQWSEGTRAYVDKCREPASKLNARYIGFQSSLTAACTAPK